MALILWNRRARLPRTRSCNTGRGLNVKPSGFSSHIVHRSSVKSFRLSMFVSASLGRRTLLLVWVVKLRLLLYVRIRCSVCRDLCGEFYDSHWGQRQCRYVKHGVRVFALYETGYQVAEQRCNGYQATLGAREIGDPRCPAATGHSLHPVALFRCRVARRLPGAA